MLPKLTTNKYEDEKLRLEYNGNQSAGTIERWFEEFIGGDCHALVMDGETIFSTYGNLSYKNHLEQDNLRGNVLNYPHGLLCLGYRKHKDFSVQVYMFETGCWVADFSYNCAQENWSVDFFECENHFVDTNEFSLENQVKALLKINQELKRELELLVDTKKFIEQSEELARKTAEDNNLGD